MGIHELIFKIGVRLRNPSLPSYLKFLEESDKWTQEQLREYQLKRLRELVAIAYKESPYYRGLGECPEINTLDDIKKLPIMDKETLIRRNKDIHTTRKFRKIRLVETSGTSGQTLTFNRNEEWESATRASQFRGYGWYGVKPWDRNGYFWGYNIDKSKRRVVRVLDWLVNRFRLFSYDEENIRLFARKLQKADYVEGYSSMIYEVAKEVNRLGVGDKFHLKMVKGTSEKIYPTYQEEVRKAFGHKMISEYGATETCIVAFECPEGNMHIAMENVIVEEIDGEAVITNLVSHSFPVIRYKLGDAIKLAPTDFCCPCGRHHYVLLDVLGRVGKTVHGRSKKYPSLTFYYVFKNLTLNKGISLNYQAVQEEKGKVLLKISQDRSECEPDLRAEITKYFTDDMEFTIVWGATLHTMKGKMKDFITTLE